ncbi:hypothetical protein [Aliivibrio logei]|uniref:hypothetical protein n=1 Tax=Aliivibrio logei TaxID=688 RepID=UPI0035C89E14
MTLWDVRDRQSSHSGKLDNKLNVVAFNNGEYTCTPEDKVWLCSSYSGEFELNLNKGEPIDLSQLAGYYSAQIDDDILNLVILDDGKLEITFNHCKDKALINLILEEQAAFFKIKSNSCSFGKTEGLIRAVVENDNFKSLEIQSNDLQFPQVWIKQIN